MSNFDKINDALSSIASDSPVALELSALVVTEKADTSIALVDEAGYRMAKAYHALLEKKDMDEVRPVLKSAAQLLLAAAGELNAEYRVMSKSEFEDYAVGAIAKANESGIAGAELDSLKTSIDIAGVLFKGDNAGKSFQIPLPIIAKADATGEVDEDAETPPPAAAAAGEGEKPETDTAKGGEEEPSAAGDEATGEEAPAAAAADADAAPSGDEAPAAEAAAGDGDTPEEVAKKALLDKDDFDSEVVFKGWPMDLNNPEDDLVWGSDPAAEAVTE